MWEKDKVFGFEITRVRESTELGGTLWEMKHIATGAQLVWLDNKENNKLFSIAFRTLPKSDNGVFHILEHSVLNGSEQFPVKEPFVELLKGSMNTFLNAMTYPDKTVFPVSSKNELDFLNLTRVYLDAVFFPAIYKNPCIFQQEGWHYELQEGEEPPLFNGVVFNEMQGDFSSPDTRLFNGLMHLLYPDSSYRFIAGGDPAYIPDLTYEEFLETHKANYHPSNAYVYLDGDIPLEKVLTLLNEAFSRFTSEYHQAEISMQPPIPNNSAEDTYEGTEEDGALFVLGKIIGTWQDRKKIMALSILCSYLTGSNEAPLKKAILDSQIAQDAGMFTDGSTVQPFLALQLNQMDSSRKEELLVLLQDTINAVAAKGIAQDDILAIIDQFAFSTRDLDEPKGLNHNISALNTWLFGGDPLDGMTHDSVFDILRAETNTNYFNELLKEIDFAGDNTAMFTLLPSATKGMEEQEKMAERLQQAAKSWTEEQRSELLEQNRTLAAWQNQPDSPEALQTLPVLSLSDINPVLEQMETNVSTILGTTVLYHKSSAQGITHFHLYFSLTDCTAEQLQQLSFLTNLLGELATAKYTVADLEREQKSKIGFLDYNVRIHADRENTDVCYPYFIVSFSSLTQYEADAVALVAEILCHTNYTAEASQNKIEQILLQGKENMFQSIIASGNRYAVMRAASHFSAASAISEKTAGCDFYRYLADFADHFDEKIEEFVKAAQQLAQNIFTSQRMTLSVTSEEPSNTTQQLIYLLQGETSAKLPSSLFFPADQKTSTDAIVIPAAVSYAASSSSLQRFGTTYDGSMEVFAHIMNFNYLWNEIRVRGGAYGCGFSASETGSIYFSSFRDPSPIDSLGVFASTADFLRSFCADDSSLDSYIIGAAASQEPLLHDRDKAARADRDYLMHISPETRQLWRKQLLNTKKSDLLAYTAWLEQHETQYANCVIGNKEAFAASDKNDWQFFELK